MGSPHRAVEREYRRLAGRYDRRWAFYVAASVRETLRRLPLDAGDRMLDVACGTGALMAAVSAARPGIRLAGVDVSPEMLGVARGKLEATLAVAPAESLPFGNGSFDRVVTTSAFHFFTDSVAALGEMRRVLRPGGTLVITDWCDDYLACRICDRLLRRFSAAHRPIYGSAGLRTLIADAGFVAIDLERYRISWLWGLMTAVARRP